jgi:ketosteroid isomerase-like protein
MKIFTLAFALFGSGLLFGQSDESDVLKVNTQIDEVVVKKDNVSLRILYADDFVFTHGTGFVEGKESWLKDVQNPNSKFLSRVHDSTKVELHGNTAIVFGRLIVQREREQKIVKYGLLYVRVFERRKKKWQLISHRTTKEWHY